MSDARLTAHGESMVKEDLEYAAALVQAVNQAKGWYDDSRTFGDDIALLHSEVSEMLEAYREHGTEPMKKTPGGAVVDRDFPWAGEGVCKPEGVGSEAADVFIRLLDMCKRYGINLGEEFFRKMKYNETRPYRHGGKRL